MLESSLGTVGFINVSRSAQRFGDQPSSESVALRSVLEVLSRMVSAQTVIEVGNVGVLRQGRRTSRRQNHSNKSDIAAASRRLEARRTVRRDWMPAQRSGGRPRTWQRAASRLACTLGMPSMGSSMLAKPSQPSSSDELRLLLA